LPSGPYRHPEGLREFAGEVRGSGFRCLVLLHSRDLGWLVESSASVLEGSCLLVAPSRIRRPRGCRAVGPGGYEKVLGSEADHVIMASDGLLRPNIVAAVAGIVKGGGLLVLAAPPLDRWDPGLGRGFYKAYLLGSLGEARCILWADADSGRLYMLKHPPRRQGGREEREGRLAWAEAGGLVPRRLLELAATASQARALVEFAGFLSGRARSFLVVGDRGRGKSYLLGLALALAARRGYAGDVPVVAPSPASLSSLFRGLVRGLRSLGVQFKARRDREGFTVAVWGSWGRIYHAEPDSAKPSGMIVFDEAAAVGIARVRRLSWKSGRVLAATTLHGYEGSGRVFQHMVEEVLPKPMVSVELVEPTRYPPGDPLEEWIVETFALKPGELPAPPSLSDCSYETAEPGGLTGSRGLLRELMQLLALAHYRTEPDYILTILEAENHRVHMLRCGGRLAAAADTAVEVWREDVDEASRLTLKMLWLQTGTEPRGLKAVRVVRIAVHPKVQRRGLGSRLLRYVEEWASSIGADLVSALFGRHDVIGFWAANRYTLFYVSPRYNRATGEKNLGFAKPLTERGAAVVAEASARARRKLVTAAHAVYRDLAAEKLATLLRLTDRERLVAGWALDWAEADRLLPAYFNGLVEHEQVFDTIHALTTASLLSGGEERLDNRELILVAAHILQGKPLGEAAEYAGVTVEDAVDMLRNAVKKLLEHLRDTGR
jgi:tRNA(Met) cytidine acetyltransferase